MIPLFFSPLKPFVYLLESDTESVFLYGRPRNAYQIFHRGSNRGLPVKEGTPKVLSITDIQFEKHRSALVRQPGDPT